MKTTKEQMAERLNGRQYGRETTKEDIQLARQSGLVIIYGASDDIVEFEGAIVDEIGAYNGAHFTIVTTWTETPVYGEFKTYREVKNYDIVSIENDSSITKNRFEAMWSPEELKCSWLIKTDLPHATFDIMEEDDLFCRGIVVDLKDITPVDDISDSKRLQQLMNNITEFSDKTFGGHERKLAMLHHLKKEVDELIDSIEIFENKVCDLPSTKAISNICGEFSDCLILLLDCASHFGLTANRYIELAEEKMEINKTRKWGKPNENLTKTE